MGGEACVAINQTPHRILNSVLTEHLPNFSDKPSAIRSVSAPSAAASLALSEAESSVNTAGQRVNQTLRTKPKQRGVPSPAAKITLTPSQVELK